MKQMNALPAEGLYTLKAPKALSLVEMTTLASVLDPSRGGSLEVILGSATDTLEAMVIKRSQN